MQDIYLWTWGSLGHKNEKKWGINSGASIPPKIKKNVAQISPQTFKFGDANKSWSEARGSNVQVMTDYTNNTIG